MKKNFSKDEIIEKVKKLIELHRQGLLGGERMPEDSNPSLAKDDEKNYLFFTLPMALNYQRNSYKLWESALQSWQDEECVSMFNPFEVVKMSEETLRHELVKHRVALQPQKQPEIWRRLCETLVEKYDGGVRKLFERNENDIAKIKDEITSHKRNFPYLSGTKILIYWLYVMTQKTATRFSNVKQISVAPDTHVLQASLKLGVVDEEELKKSNIREIVSARWEEILRGSGIMPIDIHTPFWLWSRNGFMIDV